MQYFSHARKLAIPLIAATAFSLLGISSSFANPPRVTVAGAGSGQLQLNNPVRFEGVAQDPQGIRDIFGTIQNASTDEYITEAGKSRKEPARIKFNYDKTQSTQWISQSFNLPRGRYIFRIWAQDGDKKISPKQEIPFVATGVKGSNTLAAAPATTQRAPATASGGAAPRIAIQFPKNGAQLAKAAAFSGIAKDDQSVVGVIATIMDKASGQFLTPNGKFAPSGQFKLRTIAGKNAQWTTPQVQLPPGDYLLSVKAVDNSGQEGQWAQSQFSIAQANQQASQPAQQATTVAAGASAANGMPYCSNQGSDADGDGFGWQNQASCVVAGSKADTHPTCASSASDPDGDGYGWENEKSCIVVTHCASAGSDPDGDGFGWENNRSCIVLDTASSSRFPRCAQGGASDPDGDGYGWENNATCRVN